MSVEMKTHQGYGSVVDTQTIPVETIGYCGACGDRIQECEEHIKYEDEVYCDTWCLVKGIGAEWVG